MRSLRSGGATMRCLSTCKDSPRRTSRSSKPIQGIRLSASRRRAAFTPSKLAGVTAPSHASETANTTGSGSARTRSITTFVSDWPPITGGVIGHHAHRAQRLDPLDNLGQAARGARAPDQKCVLDARCRKATDLQRTFKEVKKFRQRRWGMACCSSKQDFSLSRLTGTRACASLGAARRYWTGHETDWRSSCAARNGQ